jgi:GDP-L-fucose synthase
LPESRIYVAGHRGLVGSAIVRCLVRNGFKRLILRTHDELDLASQQQVISFFEKERPEFVFLAAANVGGILANSMYPAQFIRENLAIQDNVIHESWRQGAKRLLFLGSSCIYPRNCPQPIREEYLLTGPLEETNKAYAIAKIAGIEMCASYNAQYGTQFLCAMPTNLYGIGDNYDLQTSHLLPALIRKAHEGKMAGAREILAWGSGTPRRELLFSDDLADACVMLIRNDWESTQPALCSKSAPLINVGTGSDATIAELAALVCEVVGFHGNIAWDRSKPDGTPQKRLDVSRIHSLGWRARIALKEGIQIVYQSFRQTLTTA